MTYPHNLAAVPARPPRCFPLRIPVLLAWVLLFPFALLLAPVVFAVCLLARVSPFRGVAALWQLFGGVRGVQVEVDAPGGAVSIQIT